MKREGWMCCTATVKKEGWEGRAGCAAHLYSKGSGMARAQLRHLPAAQTGCVCTAAAPPPSCPP